MLHSFLDVQFMCKATNTATHALIMQKCAARANSHTQLASTLWEWVRDQASVRACGAGGEPWWRQREERKRW